MAVNEMPPGWIKNDPPMQEFEDGSVYLVATKVKNIRTNTEKWEFDKVRISADGDMFYMNYTDCCEESYDEWSPEDWDYYIRIA